jgi:hypothetical protein
LVAGTVSQYSANTANSVDVTALGCTRTASAPDLARPIALGAPLQERPVN